MSDPVGSEECLARFIVREEHIRADGTIKPDPFIPFKWVELSVTRHGAWTEIRLWQAGQLVAIQTGTTLRGRADVQTSVFIRQRLRVLATPSSENSNHADVVDWPNDKQRQKEIALEVVKNVQLKRLPKDLRPLLVGEI